MENIRLDLNFKKYSWTELDQETSNLLLQAKAASKRAHAPYSNFKVGASLLLSNGEVISGNNQENAAYPSGLCAERVAIFAAKAQYPDADILKIGVYTEGDGEAVFPCGACRQVISEYELDESKPITLFMASDNQVIEAVGIDSLLPMRFRLFN